MFWQRITIPRTLHILLGLVFAFVVGNSTCADVMVSSSSVDHLWFVVPMPDSEIPVVLKHHAREMEGPYFSRGRPLPVAPLAMASWGNQVWMIFPATPNSDPPRREALTAQVFSNSSIGIYYYDPHDQFGLVDSLSGLGNLVGFVGTADGPVALRIPTQRASAKAIRRDGSAPAQPVLESPVLEQLHGQRWEEIPLPGSFSARGRCFLAATGENQKQLVILTQEPANPGNATIYRRIGEDEWVESSLDISLSNIRAITSVDSQILLAIEVPQKNVLNLSYLRQDSLLSLTQVPLPKGSWALLGLSDGIRFIEKANRSTNSLSIRHIDSIEGLVSAPLSMQSQGLLRLRIIHIPIIFGLGVSVLVVVIITRGGAKTAPVNLPDTLRVSTPIGRLAALFIDLLVSGIVVSIIFQYPVLDLLKLPIGTEDILNAIPALLTIGLTFIHSLISEVIFGKTLGKSLLGLRIVTAQGGNEASFTATLVRNLLKLIVLLIPVLALVGLGNPNVQGLSDLMARTVVCRDKPAKDSESPKDR